MQVKKFEARSMNEALEMVKRELGPDAIILSARDHRKKYGLVGDGSVEITAAVAEQTLQKKKYAESKMKPELREKFLASPARRQRQIMNDFVESYRQEQPAERAPTNGRRYIDIEDEPSVEAEAASERIRDAAQRAWEALRETAPAPKPVAKSFSANRGASSPVAKRGNVMGTQGPEIEPQTLSTAPQMSERQGEILALKTELESLKNVLKDFQKVPQSFAGSHPGAEYDLPYDFSSTFEKLVQAGVQKDLVGEMLLQARQQLPAVKHKSRALIDGFAAKYILETTKVVGPSTKQRLQIFIGPRGAGKTSALVKMASHAVVSGKTKVALLTADHKVGAVDQMRIYAQILNVPFGVIRKASDWRPLLDQLKGFDLILCDFPGLSMKAVEDISLLKSLLPPEACESHLVLSACAKDAELEEVCRRFDVVKYSDFIFNHLDEALVHGSIYNLMRKFERPLHSFGIGPQVPEDFESATKERVLDLIFKLTKFKRAQE